ncbi:MAG: MBL fold metallo-hydrolase [Bacteroidota bacterium]|jgi:glyoxylase-like metal-dependent hydrolase (beta-lactamase superfamily II)/rhodanese-related sulfurtransferase|uniref:MBL fold metallo-hydrolase n=1 Tax=Candidatus Pollutiaquabacter sp. TaxID=3416354 RepID=UPI001A3B0B07|nr:MBL fold metallo-hydrolase [Bacteroidota bacterium]MBL7948628.1 MBL fold metallo-hydrolase [Bacteroidia bacterium]MBP6009618.1 MBL fold metallo-hydrolase [Bacteroidia bacterium]MBP7437992.1 MBL fold metallo-hydrolase [Bacteroidia bacterium]MBP7772075.1 MBL fold metallo-hydrolase [Bacteroidia bacterium]
MIIEQIYTGCLAQGAYYIESDGEAAIIDPLREVHPYLQRAEKNGAAIKYIFETHFHADFVSGHLDLSRKTGAPIIYGPNANPEFDAIIASDSQEFQLGRIRIKVLHTPGHTMESSCYLLFDESGKPHSIFTGDTLFLGDVGRPDLAQKAADMTQEQLAGMLYDSLYSKILPLPDDLTVYPAHGAGSACGKNMMKETVDSLGNQKKMNYALNQPSREAFIAAVTDGLLPPPAYFPMNVALNKKGYQSVEGVINRGMQALSVAEFEHLAAGGDVLLLDTRTSGNFASAFIPRSINIALDGQFAPWVGALIQDVDQAILLITDPGKEEESVIRLARVGFDNVLGHLGGGIDSWIKAGKEVDKVHRISPAEFAAEVKIGKDVVIDVRREGEYRAEHLEEAYNKPLDFINDWFRDIAEQGHFFLHCQGGYRSMTAASILKSRGIHDFTEVGGGFAAIASTTSLPRTDYVCQSKLQPVK